MHLVKDSARDPDEGYDALSIAGRNNSRGSELAVASGEVIARRFAIGMSGLLDPANADHAELARLIPEKSEALSASGIALFGRLGELAEQTAKLATDELLLASRACVSLASCRSPGAFVAAQQGLTFAWLARMMSHTGIMGALAMRSHGDAITPFHRAATANAARLGCP